MWYWKKCLWKKIYVCRIKRKKMSNYPSYDSYTYALTNICEPCDKKSSGMLGGSSSPSGRVPVITASAQQQKVEIPGSFEVHRDTVAQGLNNIHFMTSKLSAASRQFLSQDTLPPVSVSAASEAAAAKSAFAATGVAANQRWAGYVGGMRIA